MVLAIFLLYLCCALIGGLVYLYNTPVINLSKINQSLGTTKKGMIVTFSGIQKLKLDDLNKAKNVLGLMETIQLATLGDTPLTTEEAIILAEGKKLALSYENKVFLRYIDNINITDGIDVLTDAQQTVISDLSKYGLKFVTIIPKLKIENPQTTK